MAAVVSQLPMPQMITEPIFMIDPSELLRPEGKKEEDFRQYTMDKMDPIQIRVRDTYRKMHLNQSMAFVQDRMNYWGRFDKVELNVMDALELLNSLIDESDPDVDIPNIVHAFQTAERIREIHPQHDWFHLTGLIHDLGKVMALFGEPQWAVVGDTFAVGCEYADSIVYRESSFEGNPDLEDKLYSSKYGIYSANCGLDNVTMSWGHDEYMYRVLKNHPTCTLPEEGLAMIRFHSFYPWHKGGDYMHLCNDKDMKMLPWIREFNRFDLYSKGDDLPDVPSLIPYYQSLIDKYIPGKIKF